MSKLKQLEALGYTFSLSVDGDYTGPDAPPAEADALLSGMDGDAAIDEMISRRMHGRLLELPPTAPIPTAWEVQSITRQLRAELDAVLGGSRKLTRNSLHRWVNALVILDMWILNPEEARRVMPQYEQARLEYEQQA